MNFTHGTDPRNTSDEARRRVLERTSVEKRRLSRQYGIRQSDLAVLGRLRFSDLAEARAIAKMSRSYIEEHGDALISSAGYHAILDLYNKQLNTAQRALDKFEEFLRTEAKSPEQELKELLSGDQA